jgi:hypothetical protein
MPPVQVVDPDVSQTGNHGHQSFAPAAGLSLFSQPRLGFDIGSLLDDIRRRRDQADFEANRPGIACLILLAQELGVVSEQDIDRCVSSGWQEVYRLSKVSVQAIGDHLDNVAGILAGRDFRHDAYGPLVLSLENEGGQFYLYLSTDLRFSQFDLLDQGVELAKLVYGCLYWIVRDLGFGLLANDLLVCAILMEDELDCFQELLEAHPGLDWETLAQLVIDTNLYPFIEYYGDEPEPLIERFQFLSSVFDNKIDDLFGQPSALDEVARTLTAWEREGWSEYRHPWVAFVKETLKDWQWKGDDSHSMEPLDGEVNDVPLDYGHAIGVGMPWEAEVVEQVFQGMYESGETAMAKVRLHPDTIPQAAKTLLMLAKARGLVRLAEIICYGGETKNETE